MSGIDVVAAVLMALYGLASLIGGIMGYVKAHSVASVAAGVPCGLILLGCAAGLWSQKPIPSLTGAMVISLLLAGFFGSKVIPQLGQLGTFLQTSAGPRSVAMFSGAVVVIVISALALALRRPG